MNKMLKIVGVFFFGANASDESSASSGYFSSGSSCESMPSIENNIKEDSGKGKKTIFHDFQSERGSYEVAYGRYLPRQTYDCKKKKIKNIRIKKFC